MTWQAPIVHLLYDARYGANVTVAWRRCGHVRKRTTLARPPHEADCASGWPLDLAVANQGIRSGPRTRGACWPPRTGAPCLVGHWLLSDWRVLWHLLSPAGVLFRLGCPSQCFSPCGATP